MRTETWTFRIFAFTAGLLVSTLVVSTSATSAIADDNESNQGASCAACSSHQGHVCEGPACELSGNRFVDFWRIRKMKMGAWITRKHLNAYGGCPGEGCQSGRGHRSLQNKFGYFNPTGCGGGGCPLLGKYDMVYAANPEYFDSRDGRLYAAQGSGVPMSVPLAPNVRYSYNYGWGIPSSRLTRISRVAP